MIRQFVNIVAENYKSKAAMSFLSLHRLDVSKHLFYRSRDDAQVMPLVPEAQDATLAAGDEPPMIQRLEELPKSCVTLETAPTAVCGNSRLVFASLLSPSSSDVKVLCMSNAGDALLYYADKNTNGILPGLNDKVGFRPISVSVSRPQEQEDDDLYLMHKDPKAGDMFSCFRVLRSEGPSWRWESLPPPPVVGNPMFRSHTVVDCGRTICLSSNAEGVGTYCFDTGKCEWRHAGNWMLPFQGRAEYVPDLKLWLGFSSIEPHYLCGTSDLSAMANEHPPKLQHVWQDIVAPESCWTYGMNLVNLGSGRFCIARLFEVGRFLGDMVDWEPEYSMVILTGVEIGKQFGDEGVHAWKHRSIQYHGDVLCVL